MRIGAKSSQGIAFTSLNPSPVPTITSVTPAGVSAATPFVSVLITGTGFNADSLGILNGAVYPTLYLGPTSLRIEFTGPLAPGVYQIGVRNPGLAGSNVATTGWDVSP